MDEKTSGLDWGMMFIGGLLGFLGGLSLGYDRGSYNTERLQDCYSSAIASFEYNDDTSEDDLFWLARDLDDCL